MDLIKQCSATYFSGWSRYRCSKNAKVERDGKSFCTIHDPVRIEEKRDKRHKEYQERANKKEEIREYNENAIKYCKSKGLTLEELKKGWGA